MYMGQFSTELDDGTPVIIKVKNYIAPTELFDEIISADLFWGNDVELSESEKENISQSDMHYFKQQSIEYAKSLLPSTGE